MVKIKNSLEAIHKCTLPPQEDIIGNYIDSGNFVDLRRKLKRLCTVSDSAANSQGYLKSTASIRHEKARHLRYNYYMIHPFSDARAYWEYYMMFVLLFILVLIPIESTTKLHLWYLELPKLILDLSCCVDIGVTFMSGYYELNTSKIILNPCKVAKRYLKGYFIIDLVSSLPLDAIIGMTSGEEDYWFIKVMTFVKILRITTLRKYLDRLRDRRGYSIFKFKVIKLLLGFFIAGLWTTCGAYLIDRSTGSRHTTLTPFYHALLMSGLKAFYAILLVGHGFFHHYKFRNVLFSLTCFSMGVVLQLVVYAEIFQLLNQNLSVKNKYQHMVYQLQEYTHYKRLPESMRRRIYLYFDYRFEKKYYKEGEILGTLSDNLRQEITIQICQGLVENVDFFKGLPLSLLIRIVKSMKSEIYLTNDVIVRAGSSGNSMYFIASGTIAVYTSNGKEICHLSDGEHFGEVALTMNLEKRIATVVAIECCELFNLSRKDFQRAIGPYPELCERIRQFAERRVQTTMSYEKAYE